MRFKIYLLGRPHDMSAGRIFLPSRNWRLKQDTAHVGGGFGKSEKAQLTHW
jgi:hypothetical protein